MTRAIHLTLFIAGDSVRSRTAIANLRRLGAEVLGGAGEVEIVDVTEQPDRAEQDRILTTPTLIKRHPAPPRRVTGDLTDIDLVARALSLTEQEL